MWMVSDGHIIASSPSGVGIATTSDELGIEILSYVPRSLVPVFLTEGAQRIVGRLTSYAFYVTERSLGGELH